MIKFNYDEIKKIVRSNSDRVQKSGNYVNIFFDTTKIYSDNELDEYVKKIKPFMANGKIIQYNKFHMENYPKNNIREAQIRI